MGSDLDLIRVGMLGFFSVISVRIFLPFDAIRSVLSFDIQKLLSASMICPVLKLLISQLLTVKPDSSRISPEVDF